MMNKKGILFVSLLLLTIGVFAQKGIVKGNLTEEVNGKQVGLPFANVFLEGTVTGTTTDFDGNFHFAALPGEYQLICSFLGYETYKQSLTVIEGSEVSFQIEMKPEGVAIEGVEVVAKMNRESEVALIMEQKNASIAIETIGAKSLSAQGASNAAAGVTKVTGISKQSGSYTLNVRGLGDRYNSTTLNGLPLPSNHAEYKNINLELFSTDVIEFIGVEKAFTSKLYGDVAGANVNVTSKRHDGDAYAQLELASGYNTNLFSNSGFYLQDGPGFWGFDNFNAPGGEYVPTDYNVFENKWNPISAGINPNLTFGFNGGKTFKFTNNSMLSLFATASYDNKYGFSEKIENKVNGSGDYRNELKGETYWFETQTTAMLNLNYTFGKNNLYFNSLMLNSSNQDMNHLNGYIIDIVGVKEAEEAFLRRSNFERNLIFVNQLLGDHEFSKSTKLNWGFAFNKVNNVLPDRRNNIFVYNKAGDFYNPASNDNSNHHRYFHDLDEQEIAFNVALRQGFGMPLNSDDENRFFIEAGYSTRLKNRDFNSTQYGHRIETAYHNAEVDPWNVDAFFNDENLQAGVFQLRTFYSSLNLPVTYTGEQIVHAGLLNAEFHITDKFLAVLGARFEKVYQSVDYQTTISTGSNKFDQNQFLPSLSFKYEAGEKSNIRLAGSKTYTLPQFKERAPIQFEGITTSSVGNPYLYPSINYNADLKWEYFPKSGELFSATGFYKNIQDPINHFVMSSASNDFTYANSGDWAYAYGLELDARKQIMNRETIGGSHKLYFGANLSLMKTLQELDNQKVSNDTEGKYISSFNSDTEALQGAAPVLANANFGYVLKWKENKNTLNASLVYGYTSDRLYLLGYAGETGNQIDQAYSNLDFVVKATFNRLEVSLKASNLLNPKITRIQRNNTADHIVLQYQRGIDAGIGIKYKF